MKRRMVLTLLAVVFFIGAIAFVKYKQIQTAMAHGAWQPPPEAVTSIVARQEQWPATISSIGSVEAVHGVTVSADLAGIVQEIRFQSGASVHEGDVLVVLNAHQEQAQFAAAEAARDLAKISFDRDQALRQSGAIAQAEIDQASAELKQAEAKVGEIKATIDRKTICAPFSGILGIRQINLGQYLREGDPVVPLQSLDPIYVNFSVPQQEVASLRIGGEVQVTADEMPGLELTGQVSAINSVIDEATRNAQVQATFQNPDKRLRPGMYVKAQAILGAGDPIVPLPASAINYAPYGNSVFVIEDMKGQDGKTYKGVRQQFVKLGPSRGDQVAVLSGIKPGEEVATSGVFKLRNGAAVMVNNQIQPSNNPSPRPEDS